MALTFEGEVRFAKVEMDNARAPNAGSTTEATILNFIKNENLQSFWMDTNLMCMGEKTSSILNEIKWKKIFLFNPGEEEFLLYKI